MADNASREAPQFVLRLYQASLLVSAAAVAVTLASVPRAPVEGEYSGFLPLLLTIYAAPGALVLIVAALSWRRPVAEFGPRFILTLLTAVWGLLVLTMQLPFMVLTRAGAA
jgi:hypothetical protein